MVDNSGVIIDMYDFTTSQWIEIVVLLASVVMYYCQLTSWQQNVWSYIFSITLLCLIVGNPSPI
jgi:Flp pilus assembly protein protease CpaA